MKRFTFSPFSCPGTRQTRHGVIEGAEGTVAATRDPLVAAARHGAIEGAGGTIVATRVLVAAARHVAVEGVGGTIAATRVLVTATRHGVIEGAEGTIVATRNPLVAAARHAEIDVLGGYLAGRSYAVPDVSGGVSVMFEGVPGMTAGIQFKRGSTLPIYQITLYRPDSPTTPLVLTGDEVRLVAKSRLTGATVINKPLEILDPLTGLCQLTRQADEFHGGEICQAEIIVTFGNGAVLILPTRGYYTLTIEDSLA